MTQKRTTQKRTTQERNSALRHARLRHARRRTHERLRTHQERACAARARVCVGSPGETRERAKRTRISSLAAVPFSLPVAAGAVLAACENRCCDPSARGVGALIWPR